MSDTYTHKCIKPACSNSYTTTDPDAYYCESCKAQKDLIAKELDEKFSRIERKETMSELQKYDEACKRTGMKFPSINDLGIKL